MSSRVRVKVTDKDKGWKEFAKAVASLKGVGAGVRVGVLEETSQGAQTYEPGGATVAEIAVLQEFGFRARDGSDVPARSFIRSTFDRMRDELLKDAYKLLAEVVFKSGKMTVDRALGLLGAKLAAGMKQTIQQSIDITPLKQSTIDKKGSDRPLIDKGRLLRAITWIVGER